MKKRNGLGNDKNKKEGFVCRSNPSRSNGWQWKQNGSAGEGRGGRGESTEEKTYTALSDRRSHHMVQNPS